jgi:hypothetical protein
MSDKIRSSFSMPSFQAIQYITESDTLLAKNPRDLKAMACLSEKIGITINTLNKSLNDWSEFFSKVKKENLENETLIFNNFLSNGYRPSNLIAILRNKMLKLDLVVRPPKGRRTKLCEALNIKEEFSDKSFANEQIWKPKNPYQNFLKTGNKYSIMDLKNNKIVFPISDRENEFLPHLFSCEREEKPFENKNILESEEIIFENIPDAKQMILEENILKIEENNCDLDEHLEKGIKLLEEERENKMKDGGNEILPLLTSSANMAPHSPLISPVITAKQSINKSGNLSLANRANSAEVLEEQNTSSIIELQNSLTNNESSKISKFISFLYKIYFLLSNFGSTYAASHILIIENTILIRRLILFSPFDPLRCRHNYLQIICQKLLGTKRALEGLDKNIIKGRIELTVKWIEKLIICGYLLWWKDKAAWFWWPDIPPWPPPKFSEESIFCGKFLSRIYILIDFRFNIKQNHNI